LFFDWSNFALKKSLYFNELQHDPPPEPHCQYLSKKILLQKPKCAKKQLKTRQKVAKLIIFVNILRKNLKIFSCASIISKKEMGLLFRLRSKLSIQLVLIRYQS
jgi:hypothetical protein